jgi:hypothetical protein
MILGYRPIYDFTAAPDLASPLASLIDGFWAIARLWIRLRPFSIDDLILNSQSPEANPKRPKAKSQIKK